MARVGCPEGGLPGAGDLLLQPAPGRLPEHTLQLSCFLASAAASSTLQPCPVEPKRLITSAQLPLTGSLLQAGAGRDAGARPYGPCSVAKLCVALSGTAGELMLGPGSARVGGLTVAVFRRVSGPRWGLPGHNLVTRHCLGHQVPVNARARCQSVLVLLGHL